MTYRLKRKLHKNSTYRFLTKKFEICKIVELFALLLKKKNTYLSRLLYLERFGRKSSVSMIKNICIKTGRSRGILSYFKLSRFKLKEFSNMAFLPGIRRSSW